MIIRLKDLHDHFAKLEFPIVNFRFSLQIFLASPLFTSSPYYGMQLGCGAPSIAPPVMAINGGGAPASGVPQWGGQGQCRLYMKTVRFDGPQALQYRLMLEKSMHPKFVHLECEIYLMGQALQGASLAGTPVTTATTNAQRIWILGIPNGTPLNGVGNLMNGNPNANATGLSGGSTLAVSLPQFGLLPTCRFSQLTLLINQKPWRDLQYNYDWEYWQHFREETRGNGNSWADGSMINYDQFLSGSALFYPFSLARAGKRLNKNEQIQISVQGTRIADANSISGITNNQTPIDLYMIIEKTARVDYYITEGSSKVVKTY